MVEKIWRNLLSGVGYHITPRGLVAFVLVAWILVDLVWMTLSTQSGFCDYINMPEMQGNQVDVNTLLKHVDKVSIHIPTIYVQAVTDPV